MAKKNIDPIADEKINEASSTQDSNEAPPFDIVAYNELRSCADLVRMYESKKLDIQPDFQRDIVWVNPAQTRFIDSLTKQLPIPSLCFSLDSKTEMRQVIDGLQRISSVIKFLTDENWKLSELDDIDSRISGKSVASIKAEFPELYDRVQNVTIPVTVLRCDYSKIEHTEYLFTVFHRLNTGGNKLNNQEIRNCIYNGSFNDLLKNLVKLPSWKKLLAIKPKATYRFAYEEIILRFFAFYDTHKQYNGKLAKYLNDYMHENRNIDQGVLAVKQKLFQDTIEFVFDRILHNKALANISKSKLEGLIIGVAKNLNHLKKLDDKKLADLYIDYNILDEFSAETLKSDVTAKDKVKDRIDAAITLFSR